jgi:transposase
MCYVAPIKIKGDGNMSRTRMRSVVLNNEQEETLRQLSRSRTEEARRVQRAGILLMAADGGGDKKIAKAVGLNKNSVRNTIAKFHSMGIEAALSDMPRHGRPSRIDGDAKAWVISQACIKPKELGYAQELWTIQKLTGHIRARCTAAGHEVLIGIASSKVWTILDENEIKPHRIRYYLERRDPDFEAKMKEVLIVYKEAEIALEGNEESGVVSVSFDEKPGIQAIANIAPDLPPTAEHGDVGRDYEYKRLGTVSLLAGLNLITGEIIPLIRDTHKSADFIDFLKIVEEKYAEAERIRIVLDNHSAHTSKETRKYLLGRPGRFEFVFTPKHGSWLNLVESFFGKLTRVCLRGIRVTSKEELVDRIYRYIQEVNDVPAVYHWKYKMDEIAV